MPFCEINGYALPIEEGTARKDVEHIGHEFRGFGGGLITDRRARKRSWTLDTIPVSQTDAQLIKKIIEGEGIGIGFESGTGATSLGVTPTTDTGDILTNPRSAVGISANNDAIFGTKSLEVPDNRPNKVASNVATGGDTLSSTSGFSSLGTSTVTRRTADSYQGTGCIRTSHTAGAGNGIRTTTGVSGVTGQSFYVCARVKCGKGGAAFNIKARIVDDANGDGVAPYTTITGSTDEWRLLVCRGTAGTINPIDMHWEITDASGSGTVEIDIDAIMFTEDDPDAWIDGTQTTGRFDFVSSPMLSGFPQRSITVNMWALWFQSVTTGVTLQTIFDLISVDGSEGSRLALWFAANQPGRLSSLVSGPDASTQLNTYDDATADGWNMYTMAYDGDNAQVIVYLNGSAVITQALASDELPNVQSIDAMGFGCAAGGGAEFRTPIDNISMLPYVAPASQVAAWYNNQHNQSSLPYVTMAGDIIADGPLLVYAKVTDSDYLSARNSGAFANNLQRLKIEVVEV